MKSTLCALAVIAVVVGLVEAKPGGLPDLKDRGDRLALIDMAHVFKNSKEFTDRREQLKKEIEASDQKSKKLAAEIMAVQLQAKAAKPGSPEKAALERRQIKLAAEYQAYRQTEQARFLEKEAAIYKDTYLKVQDVVAEHSRKHGYPMVIRFNRSGVDAAKDPKEILNSMNRLVIHYDRTRDITDAVLAELNRRYRDKL
jgi:Skp family chaperone for outer membrane proteins